MHRKTGRFFPISREQARSYDRVDKGNAWTPNPGVTAIQAINGPGSYARAMARRRRGLGSSYVGSYNSNEGSIKMRGYRYGGHRYRRNSWQGDTGKGSRHSIAGQMRGVKVGTAQHKKLAAMMAALNKEAQPAKTTGSGGSRGYSKIGVSKAENKTRRAGARRRLIGHYGAWEERPKWSRSWLPPESRPRRQSRRKADAAAKKAAKKAAAEAAPAAEKTRRQRSGGRKVAAPEAAAPAATGRRRKPASGKPKGGKGNRKKPTVRQVQAAGGKTQFKANRRRVRRMRRRAMAPNRRHRRVRRMKHRRMAPNRMRRNRRMRRNGVSEIQAYLMTGATIVSGFIAQKALTAPLAVMLGTVDSPTGLLPVAARKYSTLIAGAIVTAGGVYAVQKFGKQALSAERRAQITGGMLAGLVHSVVTAALHAMNKPTWANAIAGNDTAARLSAMYGMGGGASIMPMYDPIVRGTGEYFDSGVSGLGEYFDSGVSGLGIYSQAAIAGGVGEYFDSGVSGLGAYEGNADVYQAAAGFGALEARNTVHLDPSSDLERAMTVAEAAAGVGSIPMQAAAGLGADVINRVGTSSTWIPGESNPALWAGVQAVNRSQESTAMIPAGILQSGGGQGIFG